MGITHGLHYVGIDSEDLWSPAFTYYYTTPTKGGLLFNLFYITFSLPIQ